MVRACVHCSAAPRATFSMPSVTMKEGMPQNAEMAPLARPQAAPTATLAASASAMALLVTAFSLFADALRDALDPKLK